MDDHNYLKAEDANIKRPLQNLTLYFSKSKTIQMETCGSEGAGGTSSVILIDSLYKMLRSHR